MIVSVVIVVWRRYGNLSRGTDWVGTENGSEGVLSFKKRPYRLIDSDPVSGYRVGGLPIFSQSVSDV